MVEADGGEGASAIELLRVHILSVLGVAALVLLVGWPLPKAAALGCSMLGVGPRFAHPPVAVALTLTTFAGLDDWRSRISASIHAEKDAMRVERDWTPELLALSLASLMKMSAGNLLWSVVLQFFISVRSSDQRWPSVASV